jgi:DNA-binding LacI/PurR family transcriptional regulator
LSNFIPLYEKLVGEYERRILERELVPGDKIDSITEIQKKHSVARETAKRCLTILAEKGLIVKRIGTGSYVAETGPKKKIWGFIVPYYNVHFDECIHTFKRFAAMRDREFDHYCSYDQWEEELRIVSKMVSERYEAIIVVPTKEEYLSQKFYNTLTLNDSKVVFMDSVLINSSYPYAIQNYGIGIVRAMEYLINKYKGKIAYIVNEVWHDKNPMEDMKEGLFMDYHEKNYKGSQGVIVSQINEDVICALIKKGTTGFVCCDDYRALKLVATLKSLNINIGSKIGLVSFGNTEIAKHFTPAMTSIDFHYNDMINAAIEIIQNSESEQQRVIEVELVIRNT